MSDGSAVSDNRELLATNLQDKTARAIVKRVGVVTDAASIADLVSRAAAARLAAIEKELASADTDLA